ncbi:hypothetical protein [Pseudomonas borbori]|uniref:Uncharacterized protein n=1 Tax=Pseudomonas borbori TaxID=289003 RepID=A0A1I5MU05_9PSED|nr:hypothetical protein [Pseudomonas borbori]SFP12837.1 hypothetical protein SAMN05216190_105102 [Pseudomonas borbori]
MIQAMRSRHTGLARNLLALWFVLFFACSFTHVQAATSDMMDEASASLASPLHGDHAHTRHDPSAADSCSTLQNAPLNQQLLTLLALTALLGLAGSLGLLTGLQRRTSSLRAPLFSPGLPTPIRKQLHRYNE